MSRRATTGLLLAMLAGALVIAVKALPMHRPLTASLGVENRSAVATLERGHTACQGPTQVEPNTRAVRWVLNPRGRPGPPLVLRAVAGGRTVARSTVAPGYGSGPRDLAIRGLPSSELIDLCLTNRGGGVVDIYGTQDAETANNTPTSALSLDGKRLPADAAIDFVGSRSGSFAGQLAAVPRRASAWLPDPLGAWFIAILLIGAPVALVGCLLVAVRAAAKMSEDRELS